MPSSHTCCRAGTISKGTAVPRASTLPAPHVHGRVLPACPQHAPSWEQETPWRSSSPFLSGKRVPVSWSHHLVHCVSGFGFYPEKPTEPHVAGDTVQRQDGLQVNALRTTKYLAKIGQQGGFWTKASLLFYKLVPPWTRQREAPALTFQYLILCFIKFTAYFTLRGIKRRLGIIQTFHLQLKLTPR